MGKKEERLPLGVWSGVSNEEPGRLWRAEKESEKHRKEVITCHGQARRAGEGRENWKKPERVGESERAEKRRRETK